MVTNRNAFDQDDQKLSSNYQVSSCKITTTWYDNARGALTIRIYFSTTFSIEYSFFLSFIPTEIKWIASSHHTTGFNSNLLHVNMIFNSNKNEMKHNKTIWSIQ